MALILGFDQSITQTGWCLYQWPGNEKLMVCGSFSAKMGHDAEEQCDIFGRQLKRLVGPRRKELSLIVWERARRRITAYEKKEDPNDLLTDARTGQNWKRPKFTVNASQLLLPEIQGMIRAMAIAYRIPYESVPTDTWRADIFGPGGGSMDRGTGKAAAKTYCRMLGIKANNENEAEAACITRWGATCSQVFRLAQHKAERAA